MSKQNSNKLALVASLAMFLVLVGYTQALRHCNMKCSLQKNLVWATDGTRCRVFQNSCLLRLEQCNRANKRLPKLVETDKETCKQNCELFCTSDYNPICVQNIEDSSLETYSNECNMLNHMCTEEKTYFLINRSECPV